MKKVRVAVVWQLASCAQVTWRMPNLEGIMVSLHQDVFFQGHNVTGTWFNHVQYCANLWARTERWNNHKQVVCWQGWSISWSRLDYVEQTEMVTVAMVVYRVFFCHELQTIAAWQPLDSQFGSCLVSCLMFCDNDKSIPPKHLMNVSKTPPN